MVEKDRENMVKVYPKNDRCGRGHPYRVDGHIHWRVVRGKLYADCKTCKQERYPKESHSDEYKARRRDNYQRTTELNRRLQAVVQGNTTYHDKQYVVDHETGCWYWKNLVDGEPIVDSEGTAQANAAEWVWCVLRGPMAWGTELQPLCGIAYCVCPEHQTVVEAKAHIKEAEYAAYLADEEGI